jgi:hypothetical protein
LIVIDTVCNTAREIRSAAIASALSRRFVSPNAGAPAFGKLKLRGGEKCHQRNASNSEIADDAHKISGSLHWVISRNDPCAKESHFCRKEYDISSAQDLFACLSYRTNYACKYRR